MSTALLAPQTSLLAARSATDGDVVPRALGGQISRRTVLAALSALAVGGLTGCSTSGSDQQDISGLGGPEARGGAAGPGGGGLEPKGPLSLNVACELTEDYFLVQHHEIDPKKDTVVAYSRADGEVEAMVLQDGIVKQIHRDPTQAGGWNVNTLSDGQHVTAMVAGISQPSGTPARLKVFYVRSDVPNTLFVAVENGSDSGQPSSSFTTTSIPWSSLSLGLQLTRSWDGGVLVTALRPIDAGGKAVGGLYFYSDGLAKDANAGHQSVAASYGDLTGFPWNGGGSDFAYVGGSGSGWSAVVANPAQHNGVPTLMLCLPVTQSEATGTFIKAQSVNIWSSALTAGHTTGTQMMNWSATVSMPPAAPTAPAEYAVEHVTTLGSRRQPVMLVRTLEQEDQAQRLWLLSPDDDGQHTPWTWTPLDLPRDLGDGAPVVLSTGTRPTSDENRADVDPTACLDVFVVTENTLSVFRQSLQGDAALDYTHPLYHPVTPLQPEVALMSSQAAPSSGDELLLVGTDNLLHSLVADPATGFWTGRPVQLPATELLQLSSYRTSLSLVDSWGTAVSGRPLSVSASTPVTALLDGRTITLGSDPVTLDLDAQGQAVVSVVADGLSAPTLTIATRDLPTAQLNPSTALSGYLKGGATLNYQTPFTVDTLGGAQTSDGRALAPGAKDSGQAKDAFTNLSTAAGLALPTTLTSSRASHTLGRRHHADRRRSGPGSEGVFDDLGRWTHDALHAMKTGAAKVKEVGYDAEKKAFTLAADLEAWAKEAVTVVVENVEDAAHVFHAVLNQIGAAIRDAVKWLEAEVLDLLRGSVALGKQYETWIGQALDQVKVLFSPEHTTEVHAWLDQQRAGAVGQLQRTAVKFGSTSLAGLGDSPNLQRRRPTAGGGSLLGAPADQGGHPHTGWFFDKVKNELTGELRVSSIDGAAGLLRGLQDAATEPLPHLRNAVEDFWTFLEGALTDPKAVPTLGVAALLRALEDLVDAVFGLVEAVVETGMKLAAELVDVITSVLATPVDEALGLVGKLLDLVGVKNVTVGNVVALLFAFPSVLMYKVTHDGKGTPFGLTATARTSGVGARDAEDDLRVCAGTALGVWATIDAVSAAFTAGSGADDEAAGPQFFAAIDIAAPVLISVLTVPTTRGGAPFSSPPVGTDNESELAFGSWLAGLIPAFCVATALYIDTALSEDSAAPLWKDSLLFLTAGCGVFGLTFGCLANLVSDDWSLTECSIAVLNNVPYLVAPCLEESLVESSEGTSAAVACALTLLCGWTGATLFGFYG